MHTSHALGEMDDFVSAQLRVINAPLGTPRRRRALRIWLHVADTVDEIREVYRYAEPDSGFEHHVVVKWARIAETKEELVEVLTAVRRLERNRRLERRVLRRLRAFGYRDWWEVVWGFFHSFLPSRKLA